MFDDDDDDNIDFYRLANTIISTTSFKKILHIDSYEHIITLKYGEGGL